jgi:hypothetical protein
MCAHFDIFRLVQRSECTFAAGGCVQVTFEYTFEAEEPVFFSLYYPFSVADDQHLVRSWLSRSIARARSLSVSLSVSLSLSLCVSLSLKHTPLHTHHLFSLPCAARFHAAQRTGTVLWGGSLCCAT